MLCRLMMIFLISTFAYLHLVASFTNKINVNIGMDNQQYPLFSWMVISHSHPNFNGSLTKEPLKL